jgi:Flp pilus assembly protein TadG
MKLRDRLRSEGIFLARRARRSAGRRGEEGAALVELAVTLPLLMIVLIGTASFSMALYFLQQIGNATTSAAMSVGGEAGLFPNNDPCAAAKSFVTGALPNMAPAKLSLTLTLTDTGLNTDTYSGTGSSFTCTSAPSMEPNYPVVLTVTYAYSWFPVPHFASLPGFQYNPSVINLSSTEASIQM